METLEFCFLALTISLILAELGASDLQQKTAHTETPFPPQGCVISFQ